MPHHHAPHGPVDGAAILVSDEERAAPLRRAAILRRFNDLLAADPGLHALSDDELADRQRLYLDLARAEVLFGAAPERVAAD
jgi:hypothetical protein